MGIYVIKTLPMEEDLFLKSFHFLVRNPEWEIFRLTRNMPIRQKGQKFWKESPLFPGYLFLRIPSEMDPTTYWYFRRIPGFGHFLKQQGRPVALSGRDQEILSHFIHHGPKLNPSLARFDVNQRIRIIRGPLEGLEAYIIRVDKRKGRVTLNLDSQTIPMRIQLAYTDIDLVPEMATTQPQGSLNHGA